MRRHYVKHQVLFVENHCGTVVRMAQSGKGSIVSFQREQGFGKVNVEGVGELPFDAVVTLAKPEDLVAGTKVNVEIGPSKIPGRVKVTKLWLEGQSGEPLKQPT
jgi:hypothetical protein